MSNFLDAPLAAEAASGTISDASRLLPGLQANILQSHQSPFALHLFLHFRVGASARTCLKRLAAVALTRAATQLAHRQRRKADAEFVAPTMLTIALSCEGYRQLGIAEQLVPADAAFRTGMELRAESWLGDPAGLSTWEQYLHQRQADGQFRAGAAIHAMITLAGSDLNALQARSSDVEALLAEGDITIVGAEVGRQLFNAKRQPIEHFGYVDSISNPVFLDSRSRRGTVWDAAAPLRVVLTPCPGGAETDLGSYVVFRKLEQNVRQFADMEQALAQTLGMPADSAGAMAVGRLKDGSPLAPITSASPDHNDFDFSGDAKGVKCPFAAHVRKMNPRGSSSGQLTERLQMLRSEQRHLIARRGITYGIRSDQRDARGIPLDRPEGGVGLLFVCYQSSIEAQFEHLQRVWANSTTFPPVGLPHAGRDMLIGAGERPFPARFEVIRGSVTRHVMPSCVVPKGGEYFFAPSVAFFERL